MSILEQSAIKVSVIIPVYNPGDGIVRCLRSLQNQTLKEFEMLFIDDGGTDAACEYIRDAGKNDHRIRLLKNPHNMGAGASRNRGIGEASGEYLAFVDPDDYVSENFFELLYNQAQKTGADIAKGICLNVDENGLPDSSYDPYTLNKRICDGLKEGVPLYALFTFQHTTAIYRREMVSSSMARYAPSNFSEDSAFLLKVCYAAKQIDIVNEAAYYYVSRGGSGVRNFSINRWNGTLVSLKEMLGFIKDKRIYTKDGYQYAATRTISLLDLQKYFEDNDRSADTQEMLSTARDLVKSLPYCSGLMKTDSVIDALVKHNINLSVNPYGKIWRYVPYNEYESRVDTWVEFLQKHPEYGWASQGYVWQVFENCLTYGDWKNQKEKKKKIKELRRKARQLPDKTVLTKNFVSMRLFVDFGLDVFNLRKTRLGEAIRFFTALTRKTA